MFLVSSSMRSLRVNFFFFHLAIPVRNRCGSQEVQKLRDLSEYDVSRTNHQSNSCVFYSYKPTNDHSMTIKFQCIQQVILDRPNGASSMFNPQVEGEDTGPRNMYMRLITSAVAACQSHFAFVEHSFKLRILLIVKDSRFIILSSVHG